MMAAEVQNTETKPTAKEQWRRQNTAVRMWLQDQLIEQWYELFFVSDNLQSLYNLDRQDREDLSTLTLALHYASEQRKRLVRNDTSLAGVLMGTVRTFSDMAMEAEQKGLPRANIVRDGKASALSAGEVNAFIVGCAAGALRARTITRAQCDAIIDHPGSNNWDILVELDEWSGMESLTHAAVNMPGSAVRQALGDLKDADISTLRGLREPGHDIVTRFSANTVSYLHDIRGQYRTRPAYSDIAARLDNEKRYILQCKQTKAPVIPFANGVAMDRLQAYSHLTALHLFHDSLGR